jgi:pimeloyl-ACP methyl ester carboxylesterase
MKMSAFNFEGTNIYYEEHGEGTPLVILNGIFMSCASWGKFVPAFSRRNRLILFDFLDQGRSGAVHSEYTQELQMRVALALLDHLGIEKANIMGISYGGEVAMQLAAAHPERVGRLVLANTAAHTSPWLKDIGHGWEYAYKSYDGHHFFKACIPVVYSPQFYSDNHEWAMEREEAFARVFTPEIYDAFGRLTRSAETHDMRGRLGEIRCPTLVVSSEHDYVTPIYQQRELAQGIPGAEHAVLQDAGHAAMYEKPNAFAALVLGFFEIEEEVLIL